MVHIPTSIYTDQQGFDDVILVVLDTSIATDEKLKRLENFNKVRAEIFKFGFC